MVNRQCFPLFFDLSNFQHLQQNQICICMNLLAKFELSVLHSNFPMRKCDYGKGYFDIRMQNKDATIYNFQSSIAIQFEVTINFLNSSIITLNYVKCLLQYGSRLFRWNMETKKK